MPLSKKNSTSIPIAPSLETDIFEMPDTVPDTGVSKRLFFLSIQVIINAIIIGFIAKLLVALINLVTNLCFYGTFSLAESSPAHNQLGLWVILLPIAGGLIVGIMARLGSSAIRGHGIPEAMEQVLTNESRIKPIITLLKPLSAAISIGTGGPFGAEGPIISTGGAFGSLAGQIMRISPNERKVMLTAGATAGMAAIFGTPVSAVLLAIELLLFEFSPRSVIPVALACATGAAMHILLFGSGAVFPMPVIEAATASAMVWYVIMGIGIGIIAAFVSKSIYLIEDLFEHLPIHWMWWPAIGASVIGIVGYFAPYTLGVGYNNITELLSGSLPLQMVLGLCFLKFLSWSISLGSGTSGGTLAPLLTIGGATGVGLGMLILSVFPHAEINLPTCALIGMAAMFAGASRALLTSIVFAFEATMQPHGLLPLLAACTASYFISFFLMKGTIMTEKIQRRGVALPGSYEPDVLQNLQVKAGMTTSFPIVQEREEIQTVRDRIASVEAPGNFLIVTDDQGKLKGLLPVPVLQYTIVNESLSSLIRKNSAYIYPESRMSLAVELMDRYQIDFLPVVTREDKETVIGILTASMVFSAYKKYRHAGDQFQQAISLRQRRNKMIVKSRSLFER